MYPARISPPQPPFVPEPPPPIPAPELARRVRREARITHFLVCGAVVLSCLYLSVWIVPSRIFSFISPALANILLCLVPASLAIPLGARARRLARRWPVTEARGTLEAMRRGTGVVRLVAERALRGLPEEGYEAVPAGMTQGKGSEIAGAR